MISSHHINQSHSFSVRVSHCALRVEPFDWGLARTHRQEIERYWRQRTSENPEFFDGTVHLLSQYKRDDDHFEGTLFESPFKSFLYWRDHAQSDTKVFDIFGSALIRSLEGAVLLGRQRKGHINEGFFYLPGGLIDPRDVGQDQKVNIRSSVLREVFEETGLTPSELSPRSDFYVTVSGQQISIAVELVSHLSAEELLATIQSYLSKDPTSELEEVRMVCEEADLDHLTVPQYVATLLHSVFEG